MTLKSEQIVEMKLDDKLFGPANDVFVSRNQMSRFASEMYNRLNVFEEYEIPADKFDTSTVNDIIKQTGTQDFGPKEAIEVLDAISPYMMDFKGDLKADKIYNQMGSVFKLEKKDMIILIVTVLKLFYY